ncbi:uncharacterized protein FJT64_018625 [Amphibalanus amphitrite]|uniref:Uncharacterized protein n=1 Tax=Amphibalanus amphitrite TaxID=1232801 RepID=A0A6A4WWP2_AMPAM|nr:uncharacterized protein FJT64_018625 [Amphibalanus amphitrite]
MMRHRVAADDSALPSVELAACLAGAPHRRRNYLRLLTAVEGERAANVSTETLALAVLTLRCMEARGGRRTEHHLTETTRRLAGRQRADGGFGDLQTTLLAHQALTAVTAAGWDSAASLRFILSKRGEDGSLGDVRLTAAAIGVLGGKSLLHVTDTPCHRGQRVGETASLPSDGGRANSELPPPPPPIEVTLWLWIGSEPDLIYRQLVSVQQNASVFECLQLAAQLNKHFQFSSELWPNGHYIHTIDGYRERKEGYRFWLLYTLDSAP